MKILFAASEAFPYIKTGGLGDVVHSLSAALKLIGDDVRLVLPAYRDVLDAMSSFNVVANFTVIGVGVSHQVQILEAYSEKPDQLIYLVDVPVLFDRPGNPYVSSDGHGWPDNAERYTVFSRAVTVLATQLPELKWKPDVIHCHDWQTGLVPGFISEVEDRPKTVFTIHNLSYDGYFSHHDFEQLHLPHAWWSSDLVEFYGGFSMLKAGLVFADEITTVSPTYAKEICTPEFGYRYDGILRHLSHKLTGILNGIDLDVWDPATDKQIAAKYSASRNRIPSKYKNKLDLLKHSGLQGEDEPLLGFVGRLVSQKGVDLILGMLSELFERSTARLVVLGAGDRAYESSFMNLSKSYPDRLFVHIGYSESLAHKIEAGSDIFLMPSRFEPCGLNQMYSLRYGTPPLVNRTGGLADTVVGVSADTIKNKTANGFVLQTLEVKSLLDLTLSAIEYYDKPRTWQQICRTAMQQDVGWEVSAKEYQKLYEANVEASL